MAVCGLVALPDEGRAGQPQKPATFQEEGPPKPGGVYRRPLENDPGTLDPAFVSDIYSFTVIQQIFDGLIQYDAAAGIRPGLAQSWKASRDGRVWTFTLRRGVKFHHGREVTAEDVVYSFTRLLDPRHNTVVVSLFQKIKGAQEFRQRRSARVEGLRAVDRYTVEIVLTEPSAPFISALGVGNTKVVPREIVESLGGRFGLRPVGTGPFKFVEWVRTKRIVLQANPDYYAGRPFIDRLEYHVFPGIVYEQMLRGFERRELEESPVPATGQERLQKSRAYRMVNRPILGMVFIVFNTAHRPFDSPKVRQAFAHAINRRHLAERINRGRFLPGGGILPPGTYGYDPTFLGQVYDPGRAKALLAEAGYPGGAGLPTLEFWSNRKSEEAVAEHAAIAENLAAVGVKVKFQYNSDWPSFQAAVYGNRFALFRYSWYADTPDPHTFLYQLFHSQSPNNLSRLRDPRIDQFLVTAEGETDYNRRVKHYKEVERQIVDRAPILVMYYPSYERVFQPYVHGVQVSALGDPYIPMRYVWLDGGGPGRLQAVRP